MSAGSFIDSLYQSDSGVVYPIRVQPETELAQFGAVVNDAPAGPVTTGAPFISVRVPKRSPRLQVRHVIVKLTGQPTGQYADYKGIGTSHRLVVSNPVVFAGISKKQEATYLGTTAVVQRVVGEVN